MYKINDSDLIHFTKTGFFQEKNAAMNHLRDADEILTSAGIDYCLMFGTLLGLLRHEDFIPWDDDLDIIIFDIHKFEKMCIENFENNNYTVLQDIRRGMRCGYRIYSRDGNNIPGVGWKFPWLGIWEPLIKNEMMTLPPEKFIYNKEDFFPLQRRQFNNFSVLIPNNSDKILNEYFGTDDWMRYCVPSALDHRQYKPTGLPEVKLPLKEVMAYIRTTEKI